MIARTIFTAALAVLLVTSPALGQQATPESEAQSVEQPSATRIALAREIVDNGFPEELREDIFFATVDQMTAQVREASLQGMGIEDQGAIAVMDGWLAEYIADSKLVLRDYIPKLMDGLALSYATIFTEQELTDIAAFVATPSGQRFMVLSSAVLAEPNFASVNQAYMNDIQAGLPAALQDLQGRLIEYAAEKAKSEAETES